MMRKLVSLLLSLCLIWGMIPAWAEDSDIPSGEEEAAQTAAQEGEEAAPALIPGAGYDFDFTLRLHPEAMTERTRRQIQGYADLLEALRFHGSFTWALNGESFELRLEVIPVDSRAGSISLRIDGAEDLMFLQSNLLSDKTIRLSNYSMLSFCSKMSEHLGGIPLHFLALLFPYSWTYGLRLPLGDWEAMMERTNGSGVILPLSIALFCNALLYRINEDEPLKALVDALCKDSDAEESFRAFLRELPDYIQYDITGEQSVHILRSGDTTVWQAAAGEIYTEVQKPQGISADLNLPWMRNHYRPDFSFETFQENQRLTGHLSARIQAGEGLEDLVNLQASIVSFPQTWPADCYSLLSLTLTGGLLPNIGLTGYLAGEQNGRVKVEFRKPTAEDMEPGPVMLTLEGDLQPQEEDVLVRQFTMHYDDETLDLFISNDAQIQAFLPGLRESLIEGLLRFLVGVPTFACQTIMDDLTDLGVFQVLLGQ